MDLLNLIPFLLRHFEEGFVTQNTGIVNQDVNGAVFANDVVNDGLGVLGDIVDIGMSLTTSLLDFVNHSRGILEIIDNHLSTILGKELGVVTAQTGTSTSDQHNLVLQGHRSTRVVISWQLVGLLGQGSEIIGHEWVLSLQVFRSASVLKVENFVKLLGHRFSSEGLIWLEENTTRTFPTDLSKETSSNLKYLSRDLSAVTGQVQDQWGNFFWRQLLQDLRRQHTLGHSGSCQWSNYISLNVVLVTLLGQGLSKTNKTHLGGRVVGLTKVSVQTSRRSSIDNTTILLLTEVRPSGLGHLEGTVQVNVQNQLEILFLHLLERSITQNTSVIDDHMDSTKVLDGSLNNLVSIQNVVVVGHGNSSSLLDLVYHNIGSFGVTSLTGSTTSTGDNDHLIFK